MADTPRMAQLRDLLADDPADPVTRYMLGMEYVAVGDDAAAVRQFEPLMARPAAPYVPAFLMAGQALVRLGREAEAAAALAAGAAAAEAAGDPHAAAEMRGLLAALG